jgi:hypothetical protein
MIACLWAKGEQMPDLRILAAGLHFPDGLAIRARLGILLYMWQKHRLHSISLPGGLPRGDSSAFLDRQ